MIAREKRVPNQEHKEILAGDIARTEQQEIVEETGRFRSHTGALRTFERFLLFCIPVMGIIFIMRIPGRLGLDIWVEQYLGAFLGLVIALVFLVVPAKKRERKGALPWYDAILAVGGAVVGGYLAVKFPYYQVSAGGLLEPTAWVLGIVAILLLLEGCRRIFGWALPILTVAVLLYAIFASHLPYPLTGKQFTIPRLAQLIYVDQNGLLGMTTNVAAILVLAFIIFGRFLSATGGGEFLINLALSGFGRKKGGAAKAAVGATSLLGTLTGVALACIYTTGVLTIPLMKRNKVSASMAGAIEATAATGAVILPPVMGIVAFIMALYMAKTYAEIVIAGIIPAFIYILGIYLQVDRYAERHGLRKMTEEEVPSFTAVVKNDWIFLIPIAVLIVSLLILFEDAEFCAMYATIALVGLTFFKKSARLDSRDLYNILVEMGEGTLDIGVVCGMAGIVIGCFLFTGLGLSLTETFTILSGGYLFPLLVLSGIVSIILGMGMPIVTVYIVVAILVSPVLIQLGVKPMAAHMFLLYYSVISFLTPPVCISVYAASAIAQAPPMQIAARSVRLAAGAYVVPFAFVYDPSLMLGQGEHGVLHSLVVISGAIIGMISLSLGLEGYVRRPVKLLVRCLLIGAGILCFFPGFKLSLVAFIGTCLLLALVFGLQTASFKTEQRYLVPEK